MKGKKPEKGKIVLMTPQKYSKNNFVFTIDIKEENIIFFFQNIKDFPVKTYQLELSLNDLGKMEAFEGIQFKDLQKFEKLIRRCIDSNRYDINLEGEGSYLTFKIISEIFDNDMVEFKIPEKGIDSNIKSEIEYLKQSISEMKRLLEDYKDSFYDNEKRKEEIARESFENSSILNNEEKLLISKWIDTKKIIRFNLIFTSSKEGFNYNYFHDYCDNTSPIVIVFKDNSNRKFGGYSTQSFRQPTNGYYYCRARGSFLFNLTKKQKYDLIDQSSVNAIYRYNSYGPCFGYHSSGTQYYDLYISQTCNSSSYYCYCNKNVYNSGNVNLLGESGCSSFLVSSFEAYQVIFE
jgi:hypothetical protein